MLGLGSSTNNKEDNMGSLGKVGIIGASHVGAHVADALLSHGTVEEIRICDKDVLLSRAQANDMNDAMAYYPRRARVLDCACEYEELAGCDVIVNAAGHVAASKENRDAENLLTPAEVATFAPRIMTAGFDGVWVSIANPCDVVARELWKQTGMEPGRIIGSGTALDSSRLRHALSDATGYDPASINAWMLGEHGFSEFACFSHAMIGCLTLDEVEAQAGIKLDRAAIEEAATHGGYITMQGKFCTEYSVANASVKIVEAVLGDTKLVTPVSTLVEDVYGVSGIFSSLPCVVGAKGVEQVFVPELSDGEIESWHATCKHIADNVAAFEASKA